MELFFLSLSFFSQDSYNMFVVTMEQMTMYNVKVILSGCAVPLNSTELPTIFELIVLPLNPIILLFYFTVTALIASFPTEKSLIISL